MRDPGNEVALTKPLVWKRYIDDIFFLRNIGKKEICSFIEVANNHHPTIKFMAEISITEITFLDTCVHKGYRFERESIPDVRTHFKPTESFQYTEFSSCHPPGVKKGFIKGLRLQRKLLKRTLTNSNENCELGVIQITFPVSDNVSCLCPFAIALRRADVSSPLVVIFVAGSLRPSIISLTSSNKEIHWATISNKEFLFFTWQNHRMYFA